MEVYLDEKRRRIEQFARYLRLMRLRRQNIVKRNCFAIFEEAPPDNADAPHIEESVALVADCRGNAGWGWEGDQRGSEEVPLPDRSGNESFRYIQLAFHRDSFVLDIPKNTLFLPEAEQILRQRPGFYYAQNRRDLWWIAANWKDTVEWDPLQKVYLYGDEESAAEDMAFIMFQVWKFPVDWTWYVRATSFHTEHRFEQGKALD